MHWREHVQANNRCVYCLERFHEDVSWSWLLGITQESILCPDCAEKLERITDISCEMCGRPALSKEESRHASFKAEPEKQCHDCLLWKGKGGIMPVQHRALYTYTPFLQEVIARFKYRGDAEIARLFSGDLKKASRELGHIDIVTVIPLMEERLWERGFNQGLLLAEKFPYVELLERTGAAEKQSKRHRQARIEALDGVFQLTEKGMNVSYDGKRILLIDDIYTTGATLHAAASVFYTNGAKEIFGLTVARATGSLKKTFNT
ncbi:ComF family protein [Salipaludibacillus neizhouensis]|nr:ComF family protein [Salipaludibacillus neizhouensis]